MNIATLNTALQLAITTAATTINAWSQTTYSKNHTFLDRIDIKNLPSGDNCPCSVLRPRRRSTGQNKRHQMNEFILWAFITDTSSSEFTNGEAYRKLLEDALVTKIGTLNASLSMVDVEVDYDDISHYPLLLIEMKFKVKHEIPMGTGSLLT